MPSTVRRIKRERERVKTCKFRDRTPATMAIFGNMLNKLLIFFRRPKPLSQFLFVTARMPTHFESNYSAMLAKAKTRISTKILSLYKYCQQEERERMRERESS